MNPGWIWTIELFAQKERDWKRDGGRELVLVSICQSWDLGSVCSYGGHAQERVKVTTCYSSISRAYLLSYLCHNAANPTSYWKQNKECENTIGWKASGELCETDWLWIVQTICRLRTVLAPLPDAAISIWSEFVLRFSSLWNPDSSQAVDTWPIPRRLCISLYIFTI